MKATDALDILWRSLDAKEQVSFLGRKMRLMSSGGVVGAFGMLSSGQISDIRTMLDARYPREDQS